MVSGVLKLLYDKDTSRRFNLIRRTNYLGILKGHPAIARIGHPPRSASIVGTDYWRVEDLGAGEQRGFQILARMFGLSTPVEERLFLPGGLEDDPGLWGLIPWREKNILIAPTSASPRKEMHPSLWHHLVDLLRQDGALVVQVGRLSDVHIRNTYSLLGLTTPRNLISLIRKFDLVVTSDNFIMHAAHLVGAKAVVLWGPTDHETYGYPEQIHLQCPKPCSPEVECLKPKKGNRTYLTPCPLGQQHCMSQISPEAIHEAIQKLILRRVQIF